ncbi:hypothetical protein ACHAAC_13455 [Aeromicrobium sp. CF4.19]|uniref:hypothetical protein n=1 Tax=Aeromicrobium sp. CF4.19 TaxID=3373082 RepID=UPI003EE78342
MSSQTTAPDVPAWPDRLYDLLREGGVTQFAYVPDAGHKTMINRSIADADVCAVSLTTEEEGIGLVCGAHLGGEKAVLLVQSSGIGNCVNLLSLLQLGRFPFLTLVSMRGDFGEGNPWQYPMGQATRQVCEAMGLMVYEVSTEADLIKTVSAAMTSAFQGGKAVAVLFSQSFLGAKAF